MSGFWLLSDRGANRRVLRRVGSLPVTLCALGCGVGAASAPDSPAESSTGGAVDRIASPTTVISATEAIDVVELLGRADDHFAAERYEKASEDFRRAAENASDLSRRLRGLFGWATSLDLMGKPARALSVYSRYVTEHTPGMERDRGRIRMVRLLVYLERYDEAGRQARSLVPKLFAPLEQVALYAARAISSLSEDRLSEAERSLGRGQAVVDTHSLDRGQTMPLDVAALYFSLGEVRRRRAEEIQFDPILDDFAAKLEERCQLILDSQGAFSEAMRAKDAHWSSMSGVRVGQLYQHLHRDLMAMPHPEAADTVERKQLFDGALRLRYSILLRKSVSMMRATVELLKRQKQKSRWREKAQEALSDIETAQKAEDAAIDALPYSRLQLQQVLDEMASRNDSSPYGS